MTQTPNNEFLLALTGMEKIHSNYFDSAHGLFGVVEKKYVLTAKNAKKLLKKMTTDYNILQIHDTQHFEYQDVYMDTLHHDFFTSSNKKKHSIHARTRHNSTNIEGVFQVVNWSNNRKSVYHFTPSEIDTPFSNESLTFFNGVYASITGKTPKFLPFPDIVVAFKRIILYNKSQSERVNIDYDIRFKNLRGKGNGKDIALQGAVIVESKTLNKNNFIEPLIKQYNGKRIKHINKFTLGVSSLGIEKLQEKSKRYAKIIQKIVSGK